MLCLVTDRRAAAGRDLIDVVAACLEAGLPAVQLREKDLGAAEFGALALRLRSLTARHGARLLINGRLEVALRVEADGLHLPSAPASEVEAARRRLGPGRLLGVSTHALAEVEAAARAGADFAVFGPVYDTPSKRPYGSPQGIRSLAEVCGRVSIPVLAIGGVTADRAAELRVAGAMGVAVIRALLAAPDPAAATREFLAAWGAPPPS